MTTRTIYIADDGEEFDSEEECTAHERCMTELPGILGFNDKAVFQNPQESGVDYAFSDSEYLFIVDDGDAAETFEFIKDYYGYEVPEMFHTGDLLHYDEHDDKWENVIDKYTGMTVMICRLFESVEAILPAETVSIAYTTHQKISETVSALM